MIPFKEITAVAERRSTYPNRHVWLPRLTAAPFGTPEHEVWIDNNWWMVDYQVFVSDKPQAQELAKQLDTLFTLDPHDPHIQKLVDELRTLQAKPPAELTPVERWTHSAYQLAGYCGGPQVHGSIISKLQKYSGNILEAMSGHCSYFNEPKNITALDYCEVSLERYLFPARRRICCDLNLIQEDEKLSFFTDEEFDVISICFGYKYPEDIDSLVAEFYRILKPGGTLSFVENPNSHYIELCKRSFKQNEVKSVLRRNGFGTVQIRKIPMPHISRKQNHNYHVEAIK